MTTNLLIHVGPYLEIKTNPLPIIQVLEYYCPFHPDIFKDITCSERPMYCFVCGHPIQTKPPNKIVYADPYHIFGSDWLDETLLQQAYNKRCYKTCFRYLYDPGIEVESTIPEFFKQLRGNEDLVDINPVSFKFDDILSLLNTFQDKYRKEFDILNISKYVKSYKVKFGYLKWEE